MDEAYESLLKQVSLGKSAKDVMASEAYIEAAQVIQTDTLNVIATTDDANRDEREGACQALRGLNKFHQQLVQMVSDGNIAEKALDNEDEE